MEEQRDKEAPYKIWQERGFLTVCDGNQVEYTEVTKWFRDMQKTYNIRPIDIGYDRALSGYWVPEMENYGFALTKIAQGGYTWTQPMKEIKLLLSDKKLVYQNNPILRWCLSNTGAKVTTDNAVETMKPIKLSAPQRIDGFVSLLNAYSAYLKRYEEYTHYVK